MPIAFRLSGGFNVRARSSDLARPDERLSRAAASGFLCLAVLVFLLQVLPYLSGRWLPDESWYAAPAFSIAHGQGIADPAIGPNDFENHLYVRPPGTAFLIAASFRLFGTSQIPARLPSILAGLAAILLTYALASDLIGRQAALVAAWIVATDNLIVLISRTARPDALAIMMVLMSLLAIKRYAPGAHAIWAFFSGLLMAAATMFHITVLGYIVSVLALAIILDRGRVRFPFRGTTAYLSGYFVGLLPFACWLLTTPLGRAGFRGEYLHRATSISIWSKLIEEGSRYSDLLGLNMLHGHGLESIPLRLPIPLIFLAASVLLWKFRRSWFYLELLLQIPTILWLIYTINKTSRYFSLLAPVFALAIGAAFAATYARPWLHRAIFLLSCFIIVAQISANFYLLKAARDANYDRVEAELRSVVPPGEPVYGTITFWLAFHDHPYISYERTDPWMAANLFHVRYFIAGDRVMTNGLPGDQPFYHSLRQRMSEVIAQSQLVGQFADPYYGDLKVYKLRAP